MPPSMQSANSSWPQVNQGEVPSALTASITYSKFLATAMRSYGFALEATSKILEKT